MKTFLKNLSNVKLKVPPLTYKINTNIISGVRSWAVILIEGLLKNVQFQQNILLQWPCL